MNTIVYTAAVDVNVVIFCGTAAVVVVVNYRRQCHCGSALFLLQG